ncbi:MAG TPA: DUF2752 domain-containing protein [Leptolyngbya sp.]|jgi:hypothetical protein|nr:DUF2752 domain-containing protein [Leptolyngbya sp.]
MQLFSPLVRSRKLCSILVAAAGIHFGLMSLNLPGWQCPIRHGFGVPCPGCGLSRATLELLKGHVHHALEIHAFAPIVLGVGGLVVTAIVLPKPKRIRLAQSVARLEDQTGLSILLISSFLEYWLIRLYFFTTELYRVVM